MCRHQFLFSYFQVFSSIQLQIIGLTLFVVVMSLTGIEGTRIGTKRFRMRTRDGSERWMIATEGELGKEEGRAMRMSRDNSETFG